MYFEIRNRSCRHDSTVQVIRYFIFCLALSNNTRGYKWEEWWISLGAPLVTGIPGILASHIFPSCDPPWCAIMCCKMKTGSKAAQKMTSRLQQVVSAINSGFRILMRILGPITFLVANLLTLSVALLFLFIVFPPLLQVSIVMYVLNVCFALWVTTNIFFNYWLCMLTPPGSPLPCDDPGKVLGRNGRIEDGQMVRKAVLQVDLARGVSYKYCRECHAIKPPRTHHCAVSGKCVYNMDHFCPWMCNTIGYYNYRYFVLFLVYITLGSFYVVSYTLANFLHMTPTERDQISMLSMFQANVVDILQDVGLTAYSYCFSVALSASISAGSLCLWHLYLTFTNQTTIEFYTNMKLGYEARREGVQFRNPYDEGIRKNLRRVFGDLPWYRQLLPNFSPPTEPLYSFEFEESVPSAVAIV